MPILTTTIGAYPKPDFVAVPDWFRNPDTASPTAGWAEAVDALGDRAEEIFARGTRSAVDDQVRCGIDVPTDGELRRENYIHYHCRHLDGIDFVGLTEAALRGGNYRALLPTIRGPIRPRGSFLDHDYRIAQSYTDRRVKVTMPGPMTISDTTGDAYYGDPRSLGAALAQALNHEVMALARAGCRDIQIDEPVFARNVEATLDYGVENLERAFHGCPPQVTRTVHMCCGYPDRVDNPDYPKAPQSAYHRLADAIETSSVNAVSIEDAHRHNDLSLLEHFTDTTVVVGVVAIAKSRIESVEEIRDRLTQVLGHVEPTRLIAAPDCGLGLLGRKAAIAKLTALCRAARSF